MQDLKQKVLENLKTKGYHEYQLKELNPIIQATIEATKQALNIHDVVRSDQFARCKCGASVSVECESCMEGRILNSLES